MSRPDLGLEPAVLPLGPDPSLIASTYAPPACRGTLEEVLRNAYVCGARSVVVERTYIDADYRSEHQAFYSKAFRPYSSVATRLHLFSSDAPLDVEPDPTGKGYIGHIVIRPIPGAPVGRTLLAAPHEQEGVLIPPARERVSFFGQPIRARGYPFISQDGELGRCSHAAVWTVARYHTDVYGGFPVLAGDIGSLAPGGGSLGRAIPSGGLTLGQISAVFERIGLPSIVYTPRQDLQSIAEVGDLGTIARRYLDSGFPVLVAGASHVAVAIGYSRRPDGTFDYIIQDDAIGPFQTWTGEWIYKSGRKGLINAGPWEYLVVPLPTKVWVSAEKAFEFGTKVIQDRWRNVASGRGKGHLQGLLAAQTDGVTFRVVAMQSTEFKESLGARNYPDGLVRLYRYLPMPRWIWVVEAVRGGEVTEEVLIDCTDHIEDLRYIAHRVDDALVISKPGGVQAEPKREIHRLQPAGDSGPIISAVRLGAPEAFR